MEAAKPALPVDVRARLFSANAIGAHAILFGPLVGGLMAAANWTRAGDVRRGRIGAVLTLCVCAFLIGFGVFAPPAWDSLRRAVAIGGTAGFAMAVWQEQRALYGAHVAAGGQAASPLAGTFAGLCFWILVFWAFVASAPA